MGDTPSGCQHRSPVTTASMACPAVVPGGDGSALDCVICFTRYDRLFKAPKALGCGHTFCLECLSRLTAAAAGCPLRCPLCRRPTVPPRRRGPPALPTRRDLLARLPPPPVAGSVRYSRPRGLLYVVPPAGQPVPTVTLSLEVAPPQPPATPVRGGGFCRVLALTVALVLAGALTLSGVFLFFVPAACSPANVTCAPGTADPPGVAGLSGDTVALGVLAPLQL